MWLGSASRAELTSNREDSPLSANNYRICIYSNLVGETAVAEETRYWRRRQQESGSVVGKTRAQLQVRAVPPRGHEQLLDAQQAPLVVRRGDRRGEQHLLPLAAADVGGEQEQAALREEAPGCLRQAVLVLQQV